MHQILVPSMGRVENNAGSFISHNAPQLNNIFSLSCLVNGHHTSRLWCRILIKGDLPMLFLIFCHIHNIMLQCLMFILNVGECSFCYPIHGYWPSAGFLKFVQTEESRTGAETTCFKQRGCIKGQYRINKHFLNCRIKKKLQKWIPRVRIYSWKLT